MSVLNKYFHTFALIRMKLVLSHRHKCNGTNNWHNNFFRCFGFWPWFPNFSVLAKNFHFGASLLTMDSTTELE